MMKHATDTAKLREELKALKLALEEERMPLEPVWREIRLYIEPNLGKALIDARRADLAAQRDDDKIINSEPRLLLQRMAAGLQSGITNPSRQWFRLASGDPKIGQLQQVRSWLDYATECLHEQFQKSNIYTSLNSLYMHLGLFGTACALLTDNGGTPYLNVFDEGAYWIEENLHGVVDVCLFRIDMRPDQIVKEFGEEWVPEKTRGGKAAKTVWCMVFPRDRLDVEIANADVAADMPFVGVYFLEKDDEESHGILAIRGHRMNPIIAPRWQSGVNAYGVGCGFTALADCKELQSMETDRLRAVKTIVDPPLLVPSSMKGVKVRAHPGGITYYDDISSSGKAPVVPLFNMPFDVSKIDQTIMLVASRIQRLFYADLFAMLMGVAQQRSQMTATEVMELSNEKVSLLGPVLTRLNTDLLDPLVNGVWTITIGGDGLEAFPGLSSPPLAISEAGMKVEYISSLHMEQQSVARLQAINALVSSVAPIAQFSPEAVDKIDTDRAIDVVSESLFEHGIVRDAKQVAEIRRNRAEMQRQQMEMQNAMAAGKAMRDTAAAVKDAATDVSGEQRREGAM